MEHTQLNSAQSYLRALISKFKYNDFEPEINSAKLTDTFKSLFSEENVFWKRLDAHTDWQKWNFIELKSFKGWEPTRIGFCCGKHYLTISVFQELDGSRFVGEKMNHKINLIEVWLNHEYLFNELWKIIIKTLRYANRESADDIFPDVTS